MKKKIKQTEERDVTSAPAQDTSTPLPSYLLDRNNPQHAKQLSSAIKNKRSEKAAKYSVPLPKVRGISEEEMFKAVGTGKKTKKKSWKRMVTKPTFGTCGGALRWVVRREGLMCCGGQWDRISRDGRLNMRGLYGLWGCDIKRHT